MPTFPSAPCPPSLPTQGLTGSLHEHRRHRTQGQVSGAGRASWIPQLGSLMQGQGSDKAFTAASAAGGSHGVWEGLSPSCCFLSPHTMSPQKVQRVPHNQPHPPQLLGPILRAPERS